MNPSARDRGLIVEPLPGGPPSRTRLAIMPLRISAVFHVLVALLLLMLPIVWEAPTTQQEVVRGAAAWLLALLAIGLAVLALTTARGLRRGRRWAWRTALVLFVLYLPSVYLPLGVVGLIGLLSPGTRARFRTASRDEPRRDAW